MHVLVKPKAGEDYDPSFGLLKLQKGGVYFSVSIKEYSDELKKIDADELDAKKFIDSKLVSNEDYQKLTAPQKSTYDANILAYNKNVENREKRRISLKESYKTVCWAWQLAGNGVESSLLVLNEALGIGIESDIGRSGHRQIYYPTLLEGGGLTWLEPFFKEKQPKGKIPHGCYVSAIGSPDIIDTIWTDMDNNPIEDTEVQFGSCLILHVYIQGPCMDRSCL
ncbi:hypothetical protein [Pedobacter sp. NJ-S-72]